MIRPWRNRGSEGKTHDGGNWKEEEEKDKDGENQGELFEKRISLVGNERM